MAHEAVASPAHGHAEAHDHPGPGVYVRIAVVLFAFTALEVLAYEAAHRDWSAFVKAQLVPILVVLSAAKFYLVAMFYMHLKQDGKLLKGVFGFSLLLAVVITLGLMWLMWYLFSH